MKTYPYNATEEERNHLKQEAGLMRRINSPYIVKCLQVYTSNVQCGILLEYMDHRDLDKILDHKLGKLRENSIKHVLKATALAISHMHERNVLHRDIKTENILVGADFTIKLCDLGVSK